MHYLSFPCILRALGKHAWEVPCRISQHQVIGDKSLTVADILENLNAFEQHILFLLGESLDFVALRKPLRPERVHLSAEVAFLLMEAHVFLIGELPEILILWDETQLEDFLYGLTATEK